MEDCSLIHFGETQAVQWELQPGSKGPLVELVSEQVHWICLLLIDPLPLEWGHDSDILQWDGSLWTDHVAQLRNFPAE